MKFQSFYYNFLYGVQLRKPRLAWRMLMNYAGILLGNKTPLRYVDICMDLKCNLTCKHCFAENFKTDQKLPLSDEEWRGVFDQCHELGNLALAFTGGEPLLRRDLENLVRKTRVNESLIVVCTNGMLITKERAQSLYRAGVDVFQVSVESMIPEEHNEFRENKQAWRKTMEGITNALEAGIKVAIVPTVSHANVRTEGFLNLLEWAHKKKLMVNLALATPMGAWNARKDILLTEDDIQFVNELVMKYPHVRRDFETNYFHRGCGAAKEKLYVTVFGDVLACPYMHISFGNVRDLTIAEIRERMLSVDKLNSYYPQCLVAEDHQFIEGPLAKLFDKDDKVVDWKDVF
jgi:MoaA/NifB/PqqE/SkfB family radical SAM enzyme